MQSAAGCLGNEQNRCNVCNVGICPKGITSQNQKLYRRLDPESAVAEIDDGPIRFVLNTHLHRDHTGGNELMGKASVLVVAHDNVRRRLSTEEWIRSLDEPALGLPRGFD